MQHGDASFFLDLDLDEEEEAIRRQHATRTQPRSSLPKALRGSSDPAAVPFLNDPDGADEEWYWSDLPVVSKRMAWSLLSCIALAVCRRAGQYSIASHLEALRNYELRMDYPCILPDLKTWNRYFTMELWRASTITHVFDLTPPLLHFDLRRVNTVASQSWPRWVGIRESYPVEQLSCEFYHQSKINLQP